MFFYAIVPNEELFNTKCHFTIAANFSYCSLKGRKNIFISSNCLRKRNVLKIKGYLCLHI